jgi:hypothetical protein
MRARIGRPPKNGIARRTKAEIREYDRQRNSDPTRVLYTKTRDLKRYFGISLEEYEKMRAHQGNLCAICWQPETWKRKGKLVALSVDHDHLTKKVRGLLCYQCNTALGKVKESETTLFSMIDYIRRHR